MKLEATELIRRFCLHILPQRFRKIRYYGFMANAGSALLQVQQKQMGAVVQTTRAIKQLSWKVIAGEKLHYDADVCPCCKKGKMVTLLHFPAIRHAGMPNGPQLLNRSKHYLNWQKENGMIIFFRGHYPGSYPIAISRKKQYQLLKNT